MADEEIVLPIEQQTVRFYRASDQFYGCFSNLFRRDMMFEDESFLSAEHAYQSAKARKPAVRAWLLAAPSPSLLAMAAHGLYSWDIAPGWSTGRYQRMQRIVTAKFTQHPDLAKILLSTGDRRIAESSKVNNEINRRWGEIKVGGVWIGENWLGKILMEVRAKLRSAHAD